jgi:hypothetical protein
MFDHRLRLRPRAASGLLFSAAVIALAGCELPERVEPDPPSQPITAPASAPAPAKSPAVDTAAAKPPAAKPKPKPSTPATLASDRPAALPRWVEAATAGSVLPPSRVNDVKVVAADTSKRPAKPPELPPPTPASTPPPQPAALAAAEPKKIVTAAAPTATPPPLSAPTGPAPTSAPAAPSAPSPKAAAAPLDPVIQIATPAYFDAPPPASRLIVPPASAPLPGLGTESKPAAPATTNVAVSTASSAPPAMTAMTATDKPGIEPKPVSSAAATAVASAKDTQTQTPNTVLPPPAAALPDVAAALPALPASDAPAATPPRAAPVADVAAATPASTVEAAALAAASIPTPIPAKIQEAPASIAPVSEAVASSAVTATPPNPLQITGGRFAGMPLPNLPALTTETPPAAAPMEVADSGPVASAPDPTAVPADADAAMAELRRASERTGLTDLQQARIEESRRLIAAGNAALALSLMRNLNAELDAASTAYVVAANDNLWRIAEKPEVYGNAYLWPLIWHANADRLKEPSALYTGMKLRIPSNPSVLEVTDAIDYARRNGGETMQPALETPAPTTGNP